MPTVATTDLEYDVSAPSPSKPNPVWDLPTRLFHWSLVATFATAWASFELGAIEVHFYAGYSLLTLVLFRLCWGFIGSRHSRFGDFLRGPRTLRRYLKEGVSPTPGHNPLGGLAVIALLSLLLVQGVSGLFNADDEGSEAPYFHLLSESSANLVGEVHETAFDLLLIVVGLHLAAIAFYTLVKRQGVIRAMLAGTAPDRKGEGPPVDNRRAFVAILLCAGLIAAVVALAPQPETISYF